MPLPPRPPKPGALASPPPGAEDAIQKSRRERDELEDECKKLEEELEALRARYEQYFLGIERKEPLRWREELRKRVLRVKGAFTRNTGLKFRIQSLNARYVTYERLWTRSSREKEEGTYRRDVFKARLRAAREEPSPEPVKEAKPKAAEPTSPLAAAAKTAAPVPEKATAPPPKPPPLPQVALSDAQMRALYDAYVAAKKSCKEDVSRLSYETLAKTVSRQLPELIARYKAKTVEFRVEVKDGRAVLKAVPKV